MGQIFEGFETGLGSHAAVKILREEHLDNEEVRKRFDEEARIMAFNMAVLATIAVIGIQIGGDYLLADKPLENIQVLDRDVAELELEITAIEEQIAAADPAERPVLERELRVLDARKLHRKITALTALRNVHRLRFLRADPSVEREGRRRVFEIFESGVSSNHALLTHAVLESLLEDIKEGKNTFHDDETDIAHLRSLLSRTGQSTDLLP